MGGFGATVRNKSRMADIAKDLQMAKYSDTCHIWDAPIGWQIASYSNREKGVSCFYYPSERGAAASIGETESCERERTMK
jgi:hypothetical protein